MDDFYHHVKKSKTLDLQREFIVGLGSKADWDSLPREKKLQAGEKLAEYITEFEKRHPHLYIYNAAVHLDESGAPHAHFNIVPVANRV
nr:plasmid recombination protein [Streptococcus gallolyticus]